MLGAGWGRPDTFTSAAATLDHLSGGRVRVNIVSGQDGVRDRIDRLRALSTSLDRDLPPLEFGLRITTFVRDTTEQAWTEAEAKVAELAASAPPDWHRRPHVAVGQQRLLELQQRGDVLDDNLYTAPGRVGGGGAGTTWLVGSPEDVANALLKYQALGINHFVLSDTPYLPEIRRHLAFVNSVVALPCRTWPMAHPSTRS